MTLAQSIGSRLKTARESANLSMMKLAQEIGIDKATINNIEQGRNMPGAKTIVALCRALGVDANYLLGVDPVSRGAVIARQNREACNKLTDAQREELLEKALAICRADPRWTLAKSKRFARLAEKEALRTLTHKESANLTKLRTECL